LNREGAFVAALLSLEPGAASADPGAAELAILDSWRYDLAAYLPAAVKLPRWPEAPPGNRIGAALSAWAQESPRPLAVFLDGLDRLPPDVRSTIMLQIRAGAPRRPRAFPWSLGLTALCDPRFDSWGSGSPDSALRPKPRAEEPITHPTLDGESLFLPALRRADVATIFCELKGETGVEVLSGAVDRAFELTQGHPFLVSALAQRIAERGSAALGAAPIAAADVDRARDIMLDRRGGLLDEICGIIRDARGRPSLEAILMGEARAPSGRDVRAALDIGLLRCDQDERMSIANPIFLELVARNMPGAVRSVFPPGKPPWVDADGKLHQKRLLEELLGFWRRYGDALFSNTHYTELSPLVLTAFLQRVVSSGGMIEREYALGRGRMDVCIRQGGEVLALVVKVWRDRDPDPLPEGLTQVDEALARLGVGAGWLILFDRRMGLPPVSQRLAVGSEKTPEGREIVVVRA
jgi:hypothetical protein